MKAGSKSLGRFIASYSFAPKINPKSRSLSTSKLIETHDENTIERLLKYEAKRNEKIEAAKLEKLKQEDALLVFKPTIHTNSKLFSSPERDRKSIYDRLSDVKPLDYKALQAEQDAGLFQPHFTSKRLPSVSTHVFCLLLLF